MANQFNNRQYAHLANPRTLFTILIALLSCYIVFYFDISLKHEMLIFGLVISFPLVFSLQSAFRRRDKALEFLSLFKAGLAVVYRSIARSKKLSEESRLEAKRLLTVATENLVLCLKNDSKTSRDVYEAFDEIFYFIEGNKNALAGNSATRVIRYMRDVYECGTYLLSLKNHRTVVALRFFSFIFINLFPFIQAATLYGSVGKQMPAAVVYLASAFSSLILITMYNVQVQLEYPFDEIGLDDIHLEDFMFEPVDKPYPVKTPKQDKHKTVLLNQDALMPEQQQPVIEKTKEDDDE